MNKAVIGVFADNVSASRAINDLKANGFGGEHIGQILREDLPRGHRLPGPSIAPGMEIIKGLVSGAIVGAILGAAGYYFGGMSVTLPSFGLSSPLLTCIVVMAIVGAVAGIIEGLLAMGPLVRASRALGMRYHGDSMVTCYTDETHAARASDILRAAGAIDVRRGASSVMDEFRTEETVQPEAYASTPPVVQREAVVAAPDHPVADTPTSGGGTIG
ncbi:MAG TPA: hypothetical protein VK009_12445 [Chloroflexota bacterium]|nr:hypothetical protein [Chloroflexota bacterium]